MEINKKRPIGLELLKRGLIKESDIDKALIYQKENPDKKLGDIFYILSLCDENKLIETIADIVEEKPIVLDIDDVKINPVDYISMDTLKKYKIMPFDKVDNKIKIAFADLYDREVYKIIRLILINKGLDIDKYITFSPCIEQVIESIEGESSKTIDENKDISALIDSIIKNAINKRASDIHIEPLDEIIRIRYRIDGQLLTVAELQKSKQSQIVGRIKAISNMFQEKQLSQDGRITSYENYNIRVSSQKNIYGEKFVLRLLKKNDDVRQIFELGFPEDMELVEKSFKKRNSLVIIAAPTGEGKTTTLYSIIDYLNKPEVNITTIEDPVEIRIDGLNQIEIDSNVSFSSSLRTVLRQDPDIILVGEIRDKETAEIAIDSGHTGHYVLTTIHTIDAVETITRLRKLGISNYDISSTLATAVSERLVRRLCVDCRKERVFNENEKSFINKVSTKYNYKFDIDEKHTYDACGCEKCNNTGYYDRIGIFEVLIVNDEIKELIIKDESITKIKEVALVNGYKPMIIDGIEKVLKGITNIQEINRKLGY